MCVCACVCVGGGARAGGVGEREVCAGALRAIVSGCLPAGGGGACGLRMWCVGTAREEERWSITAGPRTTQCVCVWCGVRCAVCGRVANQLGGCVCVWGPDVCVRGVQAGCACGYACGV